MIGIDSSALIDLFKDNEEISKLLLDIEDSIVSTYLNYLEIFIGIDTKNENHKLQKGFFEEIFNEIKLFNLDTQSCKKSSEIFWNLKKSGMVAETFDCAIAGILLTNGVNKIITKNKKHYENISGLEVISY